MLTLGEYPLISIIIPAKNEEEYIGKCLDAIKLLEYPKEKVETIVVDNGSTDGTVQKAKEYETKVFKQPNLLIGGLRNFGFQKSQGELVAFVDADCSVEPKWLLKVLKTMKTYTDICIVSAVIVTQNSEENTWFEEYWIEYLNSRLKNGLQIVDTISSFCFVIRRETMDAVGGFNEKLVTCEDYDLSYRASSFGKLSVDKSVQTIHHRNAKTSCQFFFRQLWQGGSNLEGAFSHGFQLKEIPSLLIPSFYILAMMSFLFSFLMPFWDSLRIMSFCFLAGMPILISLKTSVGRKRKTFLRYVYLWSVYLFARGLGLIVKLSQKGLMGKKI